MLLRHGPPPHPTMSQIIEQRIGTLLGNFGLLPFFALAVASWLALGAGHERWIELALVGYAAVILSFLGAVHWGLCMLTPQLNKAQIWNALGWGVTPSLLGWLALLLATGGVPIWLVILFLIGDLVLCRMVDRVLWPMYPGAPAWYPGLRTRLTAGAIGALALAFLAKL